MKTNLTILLPKLYEANCGKQTKVSNLFSFTGKNADKNPISAVNLCISFSRKRPNYRLTYHDEAKEDKVAVSEANLFVSKLKVSEIVNCFRIVYTQSPKRRLFVGRSKLYQKHSLCPSEVKVRFKKIFSTMKLFEGLLLQ